MLIFSFISFFFPRCANIIPPTGGPRDTIPPVVIESTPVNFSTRVSETVIHIEFDEFIELRNINQQFIITPPQKERPDFRVRGRNLYIDLKTDLIPNTTYTLNFGRAITDLNEGNALINYEFVFSTGDIIDSLSYSGIVLDAYNNSPVQDAVVMLYYDLQDSVPYLRMPLYANRTGKDGRFQINNLRADTFMVFALTDVNNNYLYDRPNEEKIAFLDDYITPDTLRKELKSHIPPPTDTIYEHQITDPNIDNLITPDHNNIPPGVIIDDKETDVHIYNYSVEKNDINNVNLSANFEQDTFAIVMDPEKEIKQIIQFRSGDTLYLFKEETGRQYIRRNERIQKGQLLFVFNLPLQKELLIEPINFTPPENWKLVEINSNKDSISYWITDPETQNIANMRFLVSYWTTGPSDSIKQIVDSLNMNYTEPAQTRRQTQTEEAPTVLDYSFNISGSRNQDLNKDLIITFPAPLSNIDISKTELTTIQNNILPQEFVLVQDSIKIRNFNIKTDWIPGQDYRFFAEPGAFKDIFGLESDSIDFQFATREDNHYGRILLNLTGIENNIILQLLDENALVLREYFLDQDEEVIIDYLQPQKYQLKVIMDNNNNRKWDTGNYLKGIQPERVIIFKDIITTRSNWDIEVDWKLN